MKPAGSLRRVPQQDQSSTHTAPPSAFTTLADPTPARQASIIAAIDCVQRHACGEGWR